MSERTATAELEFHACRYIENREFRARLDPRERLRRQRGSDFARCNAAAGPKVVSVAARRPG